MKKILIIASLLMATNTGFAKDTSFHQYEDIKSAVIAGRTIHIVIDFSKCTTTNNKALPSVIGAFTPNALLVMNDHIATSSTHFTLNNPTFSGKPVHEFTRYTISNDNSVKISERILDSSNLSEEVSYNCKIDVGAKIYS